MPAGWLAKARMGERYPDTYDMTNMARLDGWEQSWRAPGES
jgi:hypothetical protein